MHRTFRLAVMVVAGIFAGLFTATLVTAQPSELKSRFEVASVKRLAPGAPAVNSARFTSEGFEANGAYLVRLISTAYEVQIELIEGEPVKAVGFQMPPAYAISAKAAGPAPVKELQRMLQTLLAERFQLRFHRETRSTEVQALTVAKGGLKIQPKEISGKPRGMISASPDGLELVNSGMNNLAAFLNAMGASPRVVDMTGVEGVFSVTLRAPGSDDRGISPFIGLAHRQQEMAWALQTIGLELKNQTVPIEYFVVDSVLATPTEN